MTTRCHCVSSLLLPSRSLNFSVVARLTVATGVPPDVKRISASRPRLPTRIALFTLPMSGVLTPENALALDAHGGQLLGGHERLCGVGELLDDRLEHPLRLGPLIQ